MSSRKYPDWLVATVLIVAAGGWLAAWNINNKSSDAAADDKPASRSKDGSRSREARSAASPVKFIPDADTARLLSSFESISAGAEPGKVNKKLLHACRGVLLDGNADRRARNYSLLLQLMRAEDGPALHEQFIELHREARTYDEYKVMASRWGELDARGAIKYITSLVPMVFPGDDFRAIARGWAITDPKGALAWTEEDPELAQSMDAKRAIMEGWMREDPSTALKWIDQNMATMDTRDFVNAMQIGLRGQINSGDMGVDQALDWLNAVPKKEFTAPASQHVWQSIQWSFGEMPAERAAEVWAKVGGQQWMGIRQFEEFSGAVSHNRASADGMGGFLNELGKTWPADQVTAQFTRWTSENPEQTLNWLAKAPPSDVTTAAIKGAVETLKQTDPDAAAEWAARISP